MPFLPIGMSSSFVSLTPLIDTETGVYCHLLEIDNTRILVNCGAPCTLDMSMYDAIMPQILSCDAILLTSFSISCIGGLPHILQNNYYNKVFSSVPIKVLGKICLDEQLRAMDPHVDMDTDCLERITEIKYSQPTVVNGIEICAYNAGHSIGGCLYRITKGLERIVIGFNINHRKENHLDGVSLASIASPSLCILNSSHVVSENVSVVKRDEMFRSIVEEALDRGRTVVLPVRHSRLLEIALVLNATMARRKERAVCLSYFGKSFVERARSMIEWAGEKMSEMFSEEKVNPFELEHIEFVRYYNRMPESRVVMVVDEGLCGSGAATLLQRFNDERNVLLLTDPRMEESIRRESAGMRYYEFRLVERIVEESDVKKEMVEKSVESESDEDGGNSHWSETRYEIWCSGESEYFPSVARRRAYNDYGEYVDRSLFIKTIVPNEEVEESKVSEESVFEEREEAGRGMMLRYRIATVDFMGVSDLNSCKTILESLSPKKLVCVGEDRDTGRFFYHTFKYMTWVEEVYNCRSKIILSSDVSMGKVRLGRDFYSLNYQKIGNAFVGKFRGVRTGDVVSYVGDTPEIMVGYVDLNEIKRSLIERNMRVDQDESGLLVEDSVWVRTTSDGISIDGDGTDVFYDVRSVIYKNIAFV